jgi:adenylate kinase family enzyme
MFLHDSQEGFLIDGFPRKLDQAIEFEEKIAKAKFVLFYECDLPTLERRLVRRGETSGRADDNMETIQKRFKTFLESSMPVVDYYLSQNRCHKVTQQIAYLDFFCRHY